jgi:hypothetical protein
MSMRERDENIAYRIFLSKKMEHINLDGDNIKTDLKGIVACSREPEYLNRSGRPFLDNGSVTRFSVSLSK